MIDPQVIAEITSLEPADGMRERWQQYSETLQKFILCVSAEDRDELAQMIAERFGL